MKRTKLFGVMALMIIMAALGTASAFGGHSFGMDPGIREKMVNAIEANNYEAFKLAAENWPISSKIQDKGDFEILVQLHQAKLDGDDETVNELREQLGLPGGFGEHKMPGQSGRGRMT